MEHIIFVHGMAATKYSWFDVPYAMATLGHMVCNETLPGHVSLQVSENGGFEDEESGVSLNDYVMSVVDQFPPMGDVILVGHSMGGFIISQVAARYPDRVKKLIYVCGVLPRNGESIEAVTARSETHINGVIVEFARLGVTPAHKAVGSQPRGPLTDNIDLGHRFAEIPKHYITCSDDLNLPPDFQEQMITDWPRTQVRTIDTGHVPQKTVPEVLLLHLSEIVGPACAQVVRLYQ